MITTIRNFVFRSGRRSYVGRSCYVADTDFGPLLGNSFKPLLDQRYLTQRAVLVGDKSVGPVGV